MDDEYSGAWMGDCPPEVSDWDCEGDDSLPVTEYSGDVGADRVSRGSQSSDVRSPKSAKRSTEEKAQSEAAASLSASELAEGFEVLSGATYMEGLIRTAFPPFAGVGVMQQYLLPILDDSELGVDSLRRLLVEQSVLAHHRVAALHVASAQARTPEVAILYSGAGVKLLAEMRKTVLAISDLQKISMNSRHPRRRVTTDTERESPPSTQTGDTELTGNGITEKCGGNSDDEHCPPSYQEPTPSSGWPKKSETAEAADRGSAGAIANGYRHTSAMAEIHRAANGGW